MEQLTKEQFIKDFKAQLHTEYRVDNNEATA